MKTAQEVLHEACGCTVFTMRLHGQVYRCALSDEALFVLSQKTDPRMDRVDAYIMLKQRVAMAAQACLEEGEGVMPPLLEARHVMAYA